MGERRLVVKWLTRATYEVEQSDVDRVAVTRTEDAIEFMPEGATGPIRFEFGGRTGLIRTPSIIIARNGSRGDRGCCVMTSQQALALLEFLKEKAPQLTDAPPYAGEIREVGL